MEISTMQVGYPAVSVANYFIKKGKGEPDSELSVMKLQKMIYMAHGFMLAFHDRPLINEAIEAWRYGPVIRSVYDAFKQHGINPVTEMVPEFKLDYDDTQVFEILESVRKNCEDKTAIQLSNWSHLKDSPWDIVYNHTPYGNCGNATIKDALIKTYFEELIRDNNGVKSVA